MASCERRERYSSREGKKPAEMKKTTPMQRGYSLLEVLVAMAVFAIASLGLAAGVTTVIRAGSVSQHVTQATILAQEKLEEFRAAFEPLRDGEDSPRPGYTRSWQVTPDSPEQGVTRIAVTVAWFAEGPRSVDLVTVVNR